MCRGDENGFPFLTSFSDRKQEQPTTDHMPNVCDSCEFFSRLDNQVKH